MRPAYGSGGGDALVLWFYLGMSVCTAEEIIGSVVLIRALTARRASASMHGCQVS